jgi:hypothetical protein
VLDAPVAERDPPGQPRRQLPVVGDDDDGRAGPVQVPDQGHDGRAGAAVEVAGRLVGQHDRRPSDQRPGHRHPLALAAGQVVRVVAHAVPEPDELERLGRPPAPGPLGEPGVEQAVGHVVERRLAVEQEELLEHEADLPGPQRRELGVAERRGVVAGHQHLSGRRAVERADDVQQRRLARPRGADDGGQLAAVDGQVDARQDLQRRVAGVGLGDAAQLQHRGGRGRAGGAHSSATTTSVPSSSPSPVTST